MILVVSRGRLRQAGGGGGSWSLTTCLFLASSPLTYSSCACVSSCPRLPSWSLGKVRVSWFSQRNILSRKGKRSVWFKFFFVFSFFKLIVHVTPLIKMRRSLLTFPSSSTWVSCSSIRSFFLFYYLYLSLSSSLLLSLFLFIYRGS